MVLFKILLSIYFNLSFEACKDVVSSSKSKCGDEACSVDKGTSKSMLLHEEGDSFLNPSVLGASHLPQIHRERYPMGLPDTISIRKHHYSFQICPIDRTNDIECETVEKLIKFVPFYESRNRNLEFKEIIDSISRGMTQHLRFELDSISSKNRKTFLKEYKKECKESLLKNAKNCFGKKPPQSVEMDEKFFIKFISFLQMSNLHKIITAISSNMYPNGLLWKQLPKNDKLNSIINEISFVFGDAFDELIIAGVRDILLAHDYDENCRNK